MQYIRLLLFYSVIFQSCKFQSPEFSSPLHCLTTTNRRSTVAVLNGFKGVVYRLQVPVPFPVDSMRLATLTVSPKRQYLGIVTPTTPPTTEPL